MEEHIDHINFMIKMSDVGHRLVDNIVGFFVILDRLPQGLTILDNSHLFVFDGLCQIVLHFIGEIYYLFLKILHKVSDILVTGRHFCFQYLGIQIIEDQQ